MPPGGRGGGAGAAGSRRFSPRRPCGARAGRGGGGERLAPLLFPSGRSRSRLLRLRPGEGAGQRAQRAPALARTPRRSRAAGASAASRGLRVTWRRGRGEEEVIPLPLREATRVARGGSAQARGSSPGEAYRARGAGPEADPELRGRRSGRRRRGRRSSVSPCESGDVGGTAGKRP